MYWKDWWSLRKVLVLKSLTKGCSRGIYFQPSLEVSKYFDFFESCSLSLSICNHIYWLCRGDDCPDLMMTQNVRSCVIYRLGQKSLTKKFLKEAEHLLELSILEEQAGNKKSSWVWKQKLYIYIYLTRLERHSLQLFTILPYYFSLNTWWKRADAQLFTYCLYLAITTLFLTLAHNWECKWHVFQLFCS